MGYRSGSSQPGYLAAHYAEDVRWNTSSAVGYHHFLLSPNEIEVRIGADSYKLESQQFIDLSLAASWDAISPVDYTVSSNRAGMDFYIYAEPPASGTAPAFIISPNSTVPEGIGPSGATRDADNTRKVGGFHCLCVDADDVIGRPLCYYMAGDILPHSIWDLMHRPVSTPEGMVWCETIMKWVDIYLTSGAGPVIASAYGGTIKDTSSWIDITFMLGHFANKFLLTDLEFSVIAAGSNLETNINGSSDPGTTGGHIDTIGRRMVSNIGCEDCCGAMWQWLSEQGYQLDGADFAAAKTFDWNDIGGSKGNMYMQSSGSDVKLLAGGHWNDSVNSGTYARDFSFCRWDTSATVGARGCSLPKSVKL